MTHTFMGRRSYLRLCVRETIATSKYSFRFVEKYRVSHLWFGFGGCGYGLLPTTKHPEIENGVNIWRNYNRQIFEKDGLVWSERDNPRNNINLTHFFRSIRETVPVTEYNPTTQNREIVGYQERESGLQTMCFQPWTGLDMGISLDVYQYPVSWWQELLTKGYSEKGLFTYKKINGSNVWHVFEIPLQPRLPSGGNSPYKYYVTEIGDTGFTMSFGLFAAQEATRNPQAFAAMEQMFMRQVESVRIEPWTEQTAAEQEELRRKAVAIQHEECIAQYQRRPKDAPWWCHTALGIRSANPSPAN